MIATYFQGLPRGEGNQGKPGTDGWWVDDPWKNWNGRGDDGNGEQKFGWDGRGDRATRVWWGGFDGRRNEMVARGFQRNTF